MRYRRKINDGALLQLIDSNTPRKEIAAHFKCSEAAISKRLYKLRPDGEPLKIDELTQKEKAFVVAIASGESQTNAAFKAYDVGSRQSAKALGHELMKNPAIREALQEILDREIPLPHLVKRLRRHVDSVDPAASLKAVDMGLKLHNAYPPQRSININMDVIPVVDLSKYLNPQIDEIIDITDKSKKEE